LAPAANVTGNAGQRGVGAGTGFLLIVALWQGADPGQQYFAAYLI